MPKANPLSPVRGCPKVTSFIRSDLIDLLSIIFAAAIAANAPPKECPVIYTFYLNE